MAIEMNAFYFFHFLYVQIHKQMIDEHRRPHERFQQAQSAYPKRIGLLDEYTAAPMRPRPYTAPPDAWQFIFLHF